MHILHREWQGVLIRLGLSVGLLLLALALAARFGLYKKKRRPQRGI